jgi:hypothetical protein
MLNVASEISASSTCIRLPGRSEPPCPLSSTFQTQIGSRAQMDHDLRVPPVSPAALTPPSILTTRLASLVGQPFRLSGATRTDGSALRKLVASTLAPAHHTARRHRPAGGYPTWAPGPLTRQQVSRYQEYSMSIRRPCDSKSGDQNNGRSSIYSL